MNRDCRFVNYTNVVFGGRNFIILKQQRRFFFSTILMWKVSVKFLFWQVFGILWLKICSRMFATHIFSKGHELHCLRTIYLKRNQYLCKRDVFTTDANCIRSRINSLMTTNESIFYASKHFICNFSVWRWEKKKHYQGGYEVNWGCSSK